MCAQRVREERLWDRFDGTPGSDALDDRLFAGLGSRARSFCPRAASTHDPKNRVKWSSTFSGISSWM
jgi:hypothetical protein